MFCEVNTSLDHKLFALLSISVCGEGEGAGTKDCIYIIF